jgi:hypothetical protein
LGLSECQDPTPDHNPTRGTKNLPARYPRSRTITWKVTGSQVYRRSAGAACCVLPLFLRISSTTSPNVLFMDTCQKLSGKRLPRYFSNSLSAPSNSRQSTIWNLAPPAMTPNLSSGRKYGVGQRSHSFNMHPNTVAKSFRSSVPQDVIQSEVRAPCCCFRFLKKERSGPSHRTPIKNFLQRSIGGVMSRILQWFVWCFHHTYNT